jgi:hypothetical protein
VPTIDSCSKLLRVKEGTEKFIEVCILSVQVFPI